MNFTLVDVFDYKCSGDWGFFLKVLSDIEKLNVKVLQKHSLWVFFFIFKFKINVLMPSSGRLGLKSVEPQFFPTLPAPFHAIFAFGKCVDT